MYNEALRNPEFSAYSIDGKVNGKLMLTGVFTEILPEFFSPVKVLCNGPLEEDFGVNYYEVQGTRCQCERFDFIILHYWRCFVLKRERVNWY